MMTLTKPTTRPAPWQAAVLLAGTFSALTFTGSAAAEVLEIPLSDPGSPVMLEIDLVNGGINVVGEDRDNVVLEVQTSSKGKQRRIVTPSGSKPIPLSSYALEAEEENNRIHISSNWHHGGMQVMARVPLNTSLELDTVNNGNIVVDNVRGRLELSNVNGSITARNIVGTAVAETVNGRINLELDQVTSDSAMAFTTVNGDIDLAFPENFGADISIESRQNEIYSDFEVDVKPSSPTVSRDRHRGGVKFEVEQLLRLSINGGGTPVRIESLHGEVSLRKSD